MDFLRPIEQLQENAKTVNPTIPRIDTAFRRLHELIPRYVDPVFLARLKVPGDRFAEIVAAHPRLGNDSKRGQKPCLRNTMYNMGAWIPCDPSA